MQTSAERAYLDASAIVRLVVAETESAALKSYPTESNARTSANVARVKVVRAVRHNGPIAVRNARAVSDAIDLIQLDDELLDLAGELEPPLRDLDAIHLAAALELGDELEAVVTYDEWTARGAEALGLPVAAPAQVQRLPTPKRTVALRRATVNVSGTHAAAAFRRKPPVYGFHSPSELDGAHDSKRSTALALPVPSRSPPAASSARGPRRAQGDCRRARRDLPCSSTATAFPPW